MKALTTVALFSLVLITPAVLLATTVYVDDDGPGDPGPGDPSVSDPLEDGTAAHPYDAIQEGIDAAVGGDTVLVKDGTYTGNGNRDLDFHGKAITVASENGAATCIIDCEELGRGFRFHSGETAASMLEGFTIINASKDGNGGGISCESSSPTIMGCTVKDCYADGEGAGIFCSGGNPTIRNCKITDNSGAWNASGISSYNGASPTIVGCEITRNTPYGIRCTNSGVSVVNCLITDGFAHGGMYCYKSTATITNSTIAGNLSNVGPGVAGVYSYQSVIEISNSIVWGNSGEQIHGGGVTVTYSCIQDSDPDDGAVYPGTGNTDDDPQFYCPHRIGGGDYHIMAASPCIDAATASGAPSEDFEGELRPSLPGGGYDVRADEHTDTDSDGLPDWWERAFFGSAMGADPSGDEESDGVTNDAEYANRASPFDADTDDDGRTDAQEIAEGSCPWHIDNAERGYYVNGDPSIGDDAYDGLAPSHDGVHGPKRTIQAGIDATVTGWGYAVRVADGVYTLSGYTALQFAGKAITLESENGPSNCTIDSGGMGYAFTFHSGETAESIVDGFTITNGSADLAGGIYCRLGSPTIRDCVVTGNRGEPGAGISCDASAPTIVACTIAGNNGGRGAGLCCQNGSSPTLFNCFIVGNAALWDNGGAIWCKASAPTLVNCTIAGNQTYGQGGGVYSTGGSTPLIINCILWGNTASSGNEIAVLGSSALTVRYTDVQGGAAGALIEAGSTLDMDATCIDADPLFVAGILHDYYLSQTAAGQAADSPCVDAGSDTAAALGLDGLTTRVDGGRDAGVVDMGYHAAPAPYVTSIARSGDDVVIEWNGLAGMPYVLEWTDEPRGAEATWTELSVGAVETWTDVGVILGMPAGTMRRYRVREVTASPAPGGATATSEDAALEADSADGGRLVFDELEGARPTAPGRKVAGQNVRRGGGNVRGSAGNVNDE